MQRTYFAYGLNMDRDAMAVRCPRSRPLGPAELHGFRYVITADGIASVARVPADRVYGVLWHLAAEDERTLDDFEAVGHGLYLRAKLRVFQGARTHPGTLVYRARNRRLGHPRPGYQEQVVAAARSHGLPEAYVRTLEAWLDGA